MCCFVGVCVWGVGGGCVSFGQVALITRISTVCLTRMPKSGLVSEFWKKKKKKKTS